MWNRARSWFIYGGVWSLSAVYFTFWDTVLYKQAFFPMLAMNMLQHMVWATEGLFILELARRVPIDTFAPRAWRAWVVNCGAGVATAVLGLAIAWGISLGFKAHSTWPHNFKDAVHALQHFFALYFHSVLLIMWVVVGTSQVYFLIQRVRKGELEAAQLQHSLIESQHQALKAQLHPHFLFNTLHSISTLVHLDPDAADTMVIRLASLLRLNLETAFDQMVPLKNEIAYTELYLGIEKVRFQDRLKVVTDVAPDVLEALVPSFLLQPLVENAIKHGLSGLSRGGIITLRARREGEELVLHVEDNGVGFKGQPERVGLSNTRSRMELLFQKSHSVEISGAPDNGTCVVLRLPFALKGA